MIVPKTEVYSLAKAFYNLANAKHHFESIALNNKVSDRSRRFFKDYVRRCKWMTDNMVTDLIPESAEIFKREVKTYETLAFESVQDAMILMTQEQRNQLEDAAQSILKGTFTDNPIIIRNT